MLWLKCYCGSHGEEDFLNFNFAFSLFCYYLPLVKDVPLHLNKLESPLPNYVLLEVGLKLASGSGEAF